MKVGILSAVGVALVASSALAQVGPVFNSAPGTFMDISGTGTNLNLGQDGAANITTSIGNRVFNAGPLRIFNDGALAWSHSAGLAGFTNQPIPEPTGTPPALTPGVKYLLPYWDDLDNRPVPGGPPGGDVFWQETGDLLIIQWNNISVSPGTANQATFQVQIPRGGTTNIMMQILYQDIRDPGFGGGISATVGYVAGGTGPNFGNNSQWSFDQDRLMNGTVLTMTPAPGAAALLGIGALLAGRRRRA